MTRITEGHLARHYQGLKGGRDAALLDIAQGHALHVLHNSGLLVGVWCSRAALRYESSERAMQAASRPTSTSPHPMIRWRSPRCTLSMAWTSMVSPLQSTISVTAVGEVTSSLPHRCLSGAAAY